ncbi:DNA polymerase III subunit beta [Candidatus Gracilibacteria bacterium]|nr:DNA polymerase III subunit beta [Candidatus Gracilibacteria bacterium]
MKFEIPTKALQKGLSVVSHATAGITTTPILENILIKVNYKSIVLTANNLEMAIEYILEDDVKVISEGAFSVPSKLFGSYIGLLQDDNVSIELKGSDVLEIKTESGKTKVKGISADDFPVIPGVKQELSLSLKGRVVRQSIEKTLFSSAEGNIRPTLAGLFVNISGNETTFASTDSFRLSEYKTVLETPNEVSFSQIIPSKTCHEIKSIISDDDDVKIISGENQIAFFFGNVKMYSRLLNGKFPDYSNFFPSNYATKGVINRVDLMGALKKINLISRENNYSIKMSFSAESGILLETSETQIGEGELPLPGAVEGEDAIIGINSTYFLEALGAIETTHISLQFESPLAPILLLPVLDEGAKKALPGEFRHIIMPLKI